MKISNLLFGVLGTLLISFAVFIGYKTFIDFNKVVDITYGTDPNYIVYTKTSIKSAIENKNPATIYNINILTYNLSKEQIKGFEQLKSDNVNIKVIPVDLVKMTGMSLSEINNYKHKTNNIYKFILSEIFPNSDKILYIDSDTIVLKDLTKLYNTSIKRSYLAAVPKVEKIGFERIRTGDGKYKTVSTMKNYYDIAVILFNLDKFRKDNVKEKLISYKVKDEEGKYHVWWAFNEIIPKKNIKILPLIYGEYSRWSQEEYDSKMYNYPFIFGVNSYDDFRSKAVIIKFSYKDESQKPLYNAEIPFGDLWWHYAQMVDSDLQRQDIKIKEKL